MIDIKEMIEERENIIKELQEMLETIDSKEEIVIETENTKLTYNPSTIGFAYYKLGYLSAKVKWLLKQLVENTKCTNKT